MAKELPKQLKFPVNEGNQNDELTKPDHFFWDIQPVSQESFAPSETQNIPQSSSQQELVIGHVQIFQHNYSFRFLEALFNKPRKVEGLISKKVEAIYAQTKLTCILNQMDEKKVRNVNMPVRAITTEKFAKYFMIETSPSVPWLGKCPW